MTRSELLARACALALGFALGVAVLGAIWTVVEARG